MNLGTLMKSFGREKFLVVTSNFFSFFITGLISWLVLIRLSSDQIKLFVLINSVLVVPIVIASPVEQRLSRIRNEINAYLGVYHLKKIAVLMVPAFGLFLILVFSFLRSQSFLLLFLLLVNLIGLILIIIGRGWLTSISEFTTIAQLIAAEAFLKIIISVIGLYFRDLTIVILGQAISALVIGLLFNRKNIFNKFEKVNLHKSSLRHEIYLPTLAILITLPTTGLPILLSWLGLFKNNNTSFVALVALLPILRFPLIIVSLFQILMIPYFVKSGAKSSLRIAKRLVFISLTIYCSGLYAVTWILTQLFHSFALIGQPALFLFITSNMTMSIANLLTFRLIARRMERLAIYPWFIMLSCIILSVRYKRSLFENVSCLSLLLCTASVGTLFLLSRVRVQP